MFNDASYTTWKKTVKKHLFVKNLQKYPIRASHGFELAFQ
jgi:hypothetical protein